METIKRNINNKTTLIKNANAIVTCDTNDRVYYNSDILIQGPKIVQMGKNIKEPADETIDASGKFIYPELVNTHHHFFQLMFKVHSRE